MRPDVVLARVLQRFSGRCRAQSQSEMMLFSVELRSVPALHCVGMAIYYTRARARARATAHLSLPPHIAPLLRVFDGAPARSRCSRLSCPSAVSLLRTGNWIQTPTSTLFSDFFSSANPFSNRPSWASQLANERAMCLHSYQSQLLSHLQLQLRSPKIVALRLVHQHPNPDPDPLTPHLLRVEPSVTKR
jgi:hypothetical protein